MLPASSPRRGAKLGGAFARALRESAPREGRERRWLYVPYDQLTQELGPLSRESPAALGVVLIESPAKAARRPYHRQKLALVLANQRHFALELAARGVAVRYLVSESGYAEALAPLAVELGPLRLMDPAERELRAELAPLVARGALEVVAHEGWLTDAAFFARACGDAPPWRMDRFYRALRRERGWLMRGGKPEGGRFSFDGENRKRWRGEPPAPEPPRFEPDEITREVRSLVEERYASHPGLVDLASLPATRADAERAWIWALEHCLPTFGPYEDALSVRSSGLFHTRLSALLNLHRLLPSRVVADALRSPAPLASREGFVRQVAGWREFVHHVHVATDGLREIPPLASGDQPSFLGARNPLPPAWWGRSSGLACLDHVVGDVWREAYSHHIARLMVLGNLATLLDVDPQQLRDWFWVAYADAFDWVVEPNVLGMASFALGDAMTTKPYISGAAYLAKMGDACAGCAFDPARDCPITALYWAFLARHQERLSTIERMALPLRSLARRGAAQRNADARTYQRVLEALQSGERCSPDDLLARSEKA
ncbi:MAG: cryptochrome/photolyase family protein [Planctomycetes bacterium]|nr:cryptochrome/photolyase family protein [Planctomycetota bacterium]